LPKALEVELLAGEPEPPRILHGRVGLHAEQDVVAPRVVLVGVVDVVGRHQAEAEFPRHRQQRAVDRRLLRDPVVLEFQEEAVSAVQLGILPGEAARFFLPPLEEEAGDLPGETGAARDQPFAVAGEQLAVHPRLVVEALDVAVSHQPHQVAVALAALRQQQEVAHLGVHLPLPVEPAPGGYVHLAADDRLDSVLLAAPVEGDHPIQYPVVGESHPAQPELGRPRGDVGDAGGAVEEAVLGVYVEMGESRAANRRRHRVLLNHDCDVGAIAVGDGPRRVAPAPSPPALAYRGPRRRTVS